ncbi:hypothetical protein KIN20_036602 [Parelaphostrongylus tenuis]|uniref:Uncharacterized protein n=1 Tax=Parelaphostrongylus tenuis TaxID=148309 RepID=A0AAD5WLE6_PARTN|nr:hypothetical protein KIN20_036602 [Parelaphostrongylus tenuis]
MSATPYCGEVDELVGDDTTCAFFRHMAIPQTCVIGFSLDLNHRVSMADPMMLDMSKRLRDQRSASVSTILKLDGCTFPCFNSGLVIMLLFPGERYCFYGAARIQCLDGKLSVDGHELPSGVEWDPDSLRLVCAAYLFSRPVIF